MTTENIKLNGEVKQENLSSSEGLLTYRRKKRIRTGRGESSYQQEDAGVSVDEKVFYTASSQAKGKDFGWEHGRPVNGNRYHWKCKWCNFVGHSGGVTRLKKHLAGGWHVTPCPKVPKHVARTMHLHLAELRKNRLFKTRKMEREPDDIDETNSECLYLEMPVDKDSGQLVSSQQVFRSTSSQAKSKDVGWEHGAAINGNRYHWQCKWCNFVGRSGGVTRLKKHLAGGWNVTPCPKVPKDIASAMNVHLVELRKKRSLKSRKRDRSQDNIDETDSEYPCPETSADKDHGQIGSSMLVTYVSEQSGRAAKIFDTDSQKSRDSFSKLKFSTELNTGIAKVIDAFKKSKRTSRRSRTTSRRSRTFYGRPRIAIRPDNAKAMKEPHDSVLNSDIYKEGDLVTTDSHWRSVLKHMLRLPDVCEGGGIESSIRDALIYGPCPPCGNRKSKLSDVPLESAEPKDSHKIQFEVSRQSQRIGTGNRKSKPSDVPLESAEPKDSHKIHFEVSGQSQRIDTANTSVDVPGSGAYDQTDAIANKQKCQDVLFKILCSEKFILLCNLLCESFQGIKVDNLFDISQINSKMKNGAYGQSPGLFNRDIQQTWRKFQKVGEEMALLSTNLLDMSQDFYLEQVGEEFVHETSPQNCENCKAIVVAKNSNNSDSGAQRPSCESIPSTKLDQTEDSSLYKVYTCKQCGTKTNGEHSLNCDECEAVYHFSCVEPPDRECPAIRWYCSSCTNERIQSFEPLVNSTQQHSLHDNCAVCERLEISEAKDHLNEDDQLVMLANGSRESSVSIMESIERPEPSRTAISRLCKHCGTCEDEDKRFLTCGHSQCPYKYYHIRCLKTSQIASFQQQNNHCWYCPSCLCRACFLDRDDDLIVLCDGCDEAYHTYCMKPPRNSVPKGHWYCLQCNVAKAKEGMRKYEQWILQQHGKKDARQVNEEVSRSMDVLLSAVEKLSSEEKLAAETKEE